VSVRAEILLALLRPAPRTWTELAEAGLCRAAALTAVGELVGSGRYRVLVGPLGVELEDRHG
jgi:hypothetical protein